MSQIRSRVLVLSGKGGVGKSTTSVHLALALCLQHGLRVGILDVDLCGPSIPVILGLNQRQVLQSEAGWIPVAVPVPRGSLQVMSLAFLLPSASDAVVWRGPKKTAMIRQLVENVFWGAEGLDILLIDTPPGTSDEHLAVVEALAAASEKPQAILVTTPQKIALSDVRKEATFCQKMDIEILGIVENMCGFVCPCCGNVEMVFGDGAGEALARETGRPVLARIPVDPTLSELQDRGLVSSGGVLDAAGAVDSALAKIQTAYANAAAALYKSTSVSKSPSSE